MLRHLRPFAISSVLASSAAWAAQGGPVLPTHHYPTDSSFHMGLRTGFLKSSSNFVAPLETSPLTDNSTVKVFRTQFLPEYQPNRNLSFGAIFNFDSVSLTDENGISKKSSGLSDQWLFTEFRMVDEPGYSIGLGGMIKFPTYSNLSASELAASSDPNQTALRGDAQIDTTALVTSEWWPSQTLRFRFDAGYTFRADGYSGEIPYMAAIGFVTPKMDFDLRVRGNMTLNNFPELDASTAQVKAGFAGSDYALSTNPYTVVLEPNIELWLSAKHALNLQYSYSLSGNRSPHFHQLMAGFIYRWTGTQRAPRKTFSEKPITMDQDSGSFEAEQADKIDEPSPQDPIFE